MPQGIEGLGAVGGDIDEVILVGGQTRMPKVVETVKNFFGKEPHKGVNPDEVVAVGAAIQAAVLSGEVKDVCCSTSPRCRSASRRRRVHLLTDRNTTILTKKSQVFSTAEDSQSAVTIRVFPGRAGDRGAEQAARPVRPGRGILPAPPARRRSR